MDELTVAEKPPRRVGVSEGILHMLGSAVVQVLLAQPFSGRSALGVMAGVGLIWVLLYLTLRVARVRTWFGAWDSSSFGFVWIYGAVLALMLQGAVIRFS